MTGRRNGASVSDETYAGGRPTRSTREQIAIGLVAAATALGLRYLLPLSPFQLPVLTVVVAVALTSAFVGLASGIATAIVGGLLSWYIFFTPFAWEPSLNGVVPLFGFSVTATVIIVTTHLYRRSEERRHRAELAALEKEAEASSFFAGEMAHRLKNALAVVQSVAFQTFGRGTPEAEKFAQRLKALADAHDLLSEHMERPSAALSEVVGRALEPFGKHRFDVETADARIAAQHTLSLALVLHELSTNSAKYGALSNETGSVSLKIEDLGERLRLVWSERNGPPAAPPGSSGFGTSLLRRIGRDTELQFGPDGFRCSLHLPKG